MGKVILKDSAIRIPQNAEHILDTLAAAGFEASVVGGCVRDSLMGRTPKDWDITTDARPDQIKSLFRKTVDTGIKHGTVTVLMQKESYEVTTYRVDGDYGDHRHPDGVTFSRVLAEDLKRRDFTINAMAYNRTDGLTDLFGGAEDLENGIIRAVGDPMKRFDEDALRMMRAVRFSAELGFEIEETTRAAIRELAPTLAHVSCERIRDELEKLIVSDHPERMRDLARTGLTAVFFPEFDAMLRTVQNNPHHRYDVGEHTIAALCASKPDRLVRLTVLLHDVGKPVVRTTDSEGIDHFKGHPAEGAKMAEDVLRRLREDVKTISAVKNLIMWHDLRPESDGRSVRKTANRVGREAFPYLLDVMEADVKGQSSYLQKEKLDRLSEIRTEWKRIEADGEAVEIRDLAVTGGDLVTAGLKAGPVIGSTLERMLGDVLKHPEHNNKEYLLKHYV